MITLGKILATQDFGSKEIEKILTAVIDNKTQELEPISRYIAEAFTENDNLCTENNVYEFINSIEYAINQLRRAQGVAETYI